jgi:hypothetical protein
MEARDETLMCALSTAHGVWVPFYAQRVRRWPFCFRRKTHTRVGVVMTEDDPKPPPADQRIECERLTPP